ncbi:sterile alpha motif domain-containing protein 3-like [Astyanax mexicanus]|uniref:Sterile alpha motif domain-containing protein 3-like n=1 Tax=Astyanax mexicanus TaxID=7994 RepID=A0A8T2LWS4_ASTMX|nr:sterile alpha motif domain-containing protein 3-like [Astyanax mexicanus]
MILSFRLGSDGVSAVDALSGNMFLKARRRMCRKRRGHCIQALSSLLSLLDDDNSVQKKRAVILRDLPHFLKEDSFKLLNIAETTESKE